MRYADTQKELTRNRIISVAAELFKVHGTDATGIAAIMKEAKLTNGAFYAHFDSKEALVEAVIEQQLMTQLEAFKKELGGVDGLKRITDLYLSDAHLHNCAEGCPSVALLGEISKRSISTRDVYTSGLETITNELLASTGSTNSKDKQTILALFGLLIGTLQLARTVTDEALARDIINGGHTAAYNLLDTLFNK